MFSLCWLQWFHYNELVFGPYRDKCRCVWTLRISQAFAIIAEEQCVLYKSAETLRLEFGGIWNGKLFPCGGFLLPFQSKAKTKPAMETAWDYSSDSDFLISLHWLQRETGKWSVSFRLPFPLTVTLFPKTSMCLPPQCDSVRWQVGLQSLKLLTPLHSHFQSITFCGWGSVNLSSFGQTGHWGEDVHSNLAVNLVPYGFSFTLCLQLGWDGGIRGNSFSPEEERITEIPPLEVLMGFYSLYLVP